jgi:hypothetical protein
MEAGEESSVSQEREEQIQSSSQEATQALSMGEGQVQIADCTPPLAHKLGRHRPGSAHPFRGVDLLDLA